MSKIVQEETLILAIVDDLKKSEDPASLNFHIRNRVRKATGLFMDLSQVNKLLSKLVKVGLIEHSEKDFYRLINMPEQKLNKKIRRCCAGNKELTVRTHEEQLQVEEEELQREKEAHLNELRYIAALAALEHDIKTPASNPPASNPPISKNFITCPNCDSTNISKISTLGRAASIGVFGLASSSIGKTYKCNKCGYKW